MKKQYLETGEIVAAHGIKGEVRIYPWSDSPEFLCSFGRFYLDEKGETWLDAERVRTNKNIVLAKLHGCDTMEQAEALRGKTVYISREDCELDEGDYFMQDLMGLAVRDADSGEEYGVITDVLQTGANDVYQISRAGSTDKLIPAISQVVLSVDLEGGVMQIRPLEGLFGED